MTWIRVDDQFADHPKVMGLGKDRLAGLGLWHVAASYCARYLTDGYVPAAHVEPHAPARLVTKMVAVKLFEPVEGGYVLHDWLKYNPSRAEVEEAQAQKRAAGRAGGLAKSQQAPQQAPQQNPSSVLADAIANSQPVPVTVPLPLPEILSKVSSKSSSVSGNGWVDPLGLYRERTRRRSVSQKEKDWLEDLHSRFSRTALVEALQAVEVGPDYLRHVDDYLSGQT